ncbi:hypothetical protein scyTo_0027549 [Scyliorhinus torazame]|uniref:Uncharacterized protein n=1 Tax=Scyliorhinus torazame TaxID=75743 RepID=A0A401QNI6_SCYTO|nr:hypothetical protein [Scyliorhinus torazame]
MMLLIVRALNSQTPNQIKGNTQKEVAMADTEHLCESLKVLEDRRKEERYPKTLRFWKRMDENRKQQKVLRYEGVKKNQMNITLQLTGNKAWDEIAEHLSWI